MIAVFRAIRENIFNAEAVESIVKNTLAEIKKSPLKTTKSKEEYIKRKNVLNREIAELTQMRLDGEINKEVFISMKKPKDDELAEIEINLHTIEHQQKTVVDENFVRSYIDDLFNKAESGNDDLMKYVVDNTVEKVVIGDSEIIIYLAVTFAKTSHKSKLPLPNFTLCVSRPRSEITKRKQK